MKKKWGIPVLLLAVLAVISVFFLKQKCCSIAGKTTAGKSMISKDAEKEEDVVKKVSNYSDPRRFSESVALAVKYLARNPKSSTVRIMLGEAYSSKGDFASAEKEMKTVLSYFPSNTWALRALGSIYLAKIDKETSDLVKAKYLNDAKELILKALQYGSKDAQVNYVASLIYLRAGDKKSALSYITSALAYEPYNKHFAELKHNIENAE